MNKNSGMCLDILNASTSDGAALQQYPCNGSTAQQFTFVPDGTGYFSIKNGGSGKCIDVTNALTSARTLLQQYTCNNANAQRWEVNGI